MALKYLSISNLSTVWTKIKAYLSANYQPKGSYSSEGHTHDNRYYTESEIDTKLSGKSDTSHTHDSRYYTESEIDTKLSGKSNTDHTHSNYLTGITKTMVTTALGYTPPTSDTNTHYTTTLYAGAKDAKSNAATTNGNSYIKLYDDSTVRSQLNIKGSGATSVTTDANGVITISSTDTNTTYSKLSQFTNDSGFITGITKAMVTNALGYTPPTSDTNTWNALKGSTTSAAGTAGYAPAPAAGAANRYLRCDGTWQVPPDNNTTYSFSNKAATLAWNTAVTVATVGGVDITVKLPANPNTNTTYSAGSNITLTGTTFSLTKANVVGALGYTPPTTNTTYSKLSQFTNDSGYITSSGSCNYANSAGNGVDSSGNNWIRFKSKTQICWGTAVISGTSGKVTYPKAFANTDYCPPTICFGDNVQFDNYLSVDDWNTSGFTIARTGPSGNARFNYICIGTWA